MSPHIVIDAVRNWLQQDIKRNIFDRVIFSSKANTSLVETFMNTSFPLYPSASRDSGSNFTEAHPSENGTKPQQNGTESQQNETELQQNGTELQQVETESRQNGTEPQQNEGVGSEPVLEPPVVDEDDIVLSLSENGLSERKERDDDEGISTEDLLASLQAIQDENMRTIQEIVGLQETSPVAVPDSLVPPDETFDMYSRSLPPPGDHYNFLFGGARSVSPSLKSSRSRSQSGEFVLNPERTESDV